LTGTITQTLTGSGGQTSTGVANAFVRKPGSGGNTPTTSFPVSGVDTNVWTYSVGATQVGQLTMTAQPVINTDNIYDAYINAAKDRDFLREGQPEKDDSVHILRQKFAGLKSRTYWIPESRAKDFFELYLKTTVKRQQAAPTSLFVDTTVLAVEKKEAVGTPVEIYVLSLRLEDKVINDSGEARIPVNGLEKAFQYKPFGGAEPGKKTDTIRLLVSPRDTASIDDFIKALAKSPIRLKGDTYAPSFVPIPDAIEPVRHELEQQRLNQFLR
jgi:hypothetical protein